MSEKDLEGISYNETVKYPLVHRMISRDLRTLLPA